MQYRFKPDVRKECTYGWYPSVSPFRRTRPFGTPLSEKSDQSRSASVMLGISGVKCPQFKRTPQSTRERASSAQQMTPKPPEGLKNAWQQTSERQTPISALSNSSVEIPSPKVGSPLSFAERRPERIRSACTIERPRVQIQRNIQSAGTSRNSTVDGRCAPTPPCISSTEGLIKEEKEEGEVVLDYDEQLKKHGWKMEIPGDPFHLKNDQYFAFAASIIYDYDNYYRVVKATISLFNNRRRCIPKRAPYTQVVSEAEVPPEPPKTFAENKETFFYNTIPRKPMSYTVYPGWPSETFLAKRQKLQQKEGGMNYRYRNFSFIY
ncbi:DgyrCDS14230 [Dimorphilus gyrociliatus]|uniref:DgyrCDS14230 n=1 Tax=Dimorphilus gyrociliatus TaxID=2664684 RepID=A0A7I8WDC0_9ANNE|nr:DgyrCDS14230 [Dimorphilus gyrociliatus]